MKYLVFCSNCKCGSMFPMPTEDYLSLINESFWTSYQKFSNNQIEIGYRQAVSRIDYMKNHFHEKIFIKVLDIGAGFGNFLDALKSKFPQFNNYYAVELDKKMSKVLIDKGAKKVYESINDIHEKDFTLIIMSHMLEHLISPSDYLLKIKKLITGDAIIFIEVPNRDDLYLERLGLHTIVFSINGIRNLLKNLDFNIINITTVGTSLIDLIPSSISNIKSLLVKIFTISYHKFVRNNLDHIIKKFLAIYYSKAPPSKYRNFFTSSRFDKLDEEKKNGLFIRLLAKKN